MTYGYTPAQYAIFRRQGWRYLLLFSILYCFVYCTRLNLSNAGTVIIDGLHWDKTDFGVLTGVLFWTYGLGHLVNGRLSEIFGPARFVVASVVLSVGVNVLMSLQESLVVMAVLWGLNGYFQSMAWTPGMALLTRWWPGGTRGFATGFAHAFSGFGQVAAILSVALALKVLPGLGWRSVFLVPAALPLLMLVLYMGFARTSPGQVGLPEYEEDNADRVRLETEMKTILATHGRLYPYKYILSNRYFALWLVIAFLTGLARYGLVTWVPLYFVDRFQIDVTTGLLGALSLPVGMGIGTLAVPWLTDKWCPDNRLPAVIVSALVGALSIGAFVGLDPTVDWQMVLIQVLLFTAGFCIYAINGTAWACATDVGGRVFSGTSSGLLDFSAYMGAAVQSFVYGVLVDQTGWGSIFASLAVFCGIMAVLGLLGRNQQIKDGFKGE